MKKVYLTIEDGKLTLWDMPRDGAIEIQWDVTPSGCLNIKRNDQAHSYKLGQFPVEQIRYF
jgi:hypothetical protein